MPPAHLYLNMMYDHILIDGKNAAYKAVFAAHLDNNAVHPSVIMIRQLARLKRVFNPKNWHVFWDVSSKSLWRRDIHPTYKDGRDKKDHGFDVKAAIDNVQQVCAVLFNNMAMTQYIRAKNEADDLIYAFTQLHPNEQCVIVSSDADMTQIPYKMANVHVHNQRHKESDIMPISDYDPVIVKALAGDKSDNIDGYRLVADITAKKIIREGLDAFLEKRGREPFDRNISIIDLSKNPYLSENIEYVKNVKINQKFDISAIQQMITKLGLTGMSAEMAKVISFKRN